MSEHDPFLEALIADAVSGEANADAGQALLQPILDDAVRARSDVRVDETTVERLFARSSVGAAAAATPARAESEPAPGPATDRATR